MHPMSLWQMWVQVFPLRGLQDQQHLDVAMVFIHQSLKKTFIVLQCESSQFNMNPRKKDST